MARLQIYWGIFRESKLKLACQIIRSAPKYSKVTRSRSRYFLITLINVKASVEYPDNIPHNPSPLKF